MEWKRGGMLCVIWDTGDLCRRSYIRKGRLKDFHECFVMCVCVGGIYGILRLGRLATLHRKKNQVSQSLDFEILLFQPPNAGVSSLHRHAQQLCSMFSLLVFLLLVSTLGIGPRALNMLDKFSALEFHSSSSFDFSSWDSISKFPRLDLNSLRSLNRPWTCHPPALVSRVTNFSSSYRGQAT